MSWDVERRDWLAALDADPTRDPVVAVDEFDRQVLDAMEAQKHRAPKMAEPPAESDRDAPNGKSLDVQLLQTQVDPSIVSRAPRRVTQEMVSREVLPQEATATTGPAAAEAPTAEGEPLAADTSPRDDSPVDTSSTDARVAESTDGAAADATPSEEPAPARAVERDAPVAEADADAPEVRRDKQTDEYPIVEELSDEDEEAAAAEADMPAEAASSSEARQLKVTVEAPAMEASPPPPPALAAVARVAAVAEDEEAQILDVDADLEEVTAPPVAPAAPKKKAPRKRKWYDDVFSEHYAALAPATTSLTAARDAAFIIECTGLQAGHRVLDVGCGDGAHVLAFAERGIEAVGVDVSLAQMFRAATANDNAGNKATFVHGDMRDLPLEDTYDVVTCIGSTFGYFEDDVNRDVLAGLRARVAPGGKLVIQVFNRDHIVARLPCRSWWQGHDCNVLDEAEMNFFANRLRVHRTVVFSDGRQFEHYMFPRAYTLHDVGKLCATVGLRVVEISGSRSTRSLFYGATSPDIWIVAEPV